MAKLPSAEFGFLARHERSATGLNSLQPIVSLLIVVLVWQLISLRYPPFILPGPGLVTQRFVEKIADGTLPFHAWITFSEAALGLAAGTFVALVAGYVVAKSRFAERVLSPFIVASQGIPFIAVAPLVFIWFGNGLPAKVLLCATIVFFPVLINVAAGLRSVPQPLRDLFALNTATLWQIFSKLEVPAALPTLVAGLRVGCTLSVIGAIAAEFVSSTRGLGFLISQGNNFYDTPLVMVGVISIMVMAMLFYATAGLLGRLHM